MKKGSREIFERASRWLIRCSESLVRGGVGVAFVVLIGTVLVQVFSRGFLDYSPVWTEELSRFSLLFLASLGGALTLLSGNLVSMDLVSERLPKALKLWIKLFHTLCAAFLGTVMILPALEFMSIGEIQSSPALAWRMDRIYLAMPLFAFLLTFFSLFKAIEGLLYFKGKNKKDAHS